MNRAQRVLASWTGFDDEYKAQRAELSNTKVALEDTRTTLSILERYVEELDYVNLNTPYGDLQKEILPSGKRQGVINRIRRMRHENPIAKQAVRLAVRFTFGRGVSYIVKDENKKRIIDSFWLDPINQAVLTSHKAMKQRFDETLTDGETFFLGFEDEMPPYLRLTTVPMEQVVELIYDPNNANVCVWYKRQFIEYEYKASGTSYLSGYEPKNAGQPTIKYYRDYRITDEYLDQIDGLYIPEGMIGEGKIYHRKINEVQMKSGRRGISELFASREWFRVFKEFMEDRGAINAAANAFSYWRQTKGGPAAVAKITGKIGDNDLNQDESLLTNPNLQRLTRPVAGAIYDSNENIQLKSVRADTGAVHAKEDARLLLMAGGAGVSTNIHYFGEGGDANLATAQAMELPMVKGYEDWQQMHEEEFDDFCQWVNRIAEGDDQADHIQIAWDFPPIIAQDVVKYTTAYAQLAQQIAPGNRVVKEISIRGGLISLDVPNVDAVMPEIIAEEDRLAAQKEADKAFQQNLQAQGANNPPGNPSSNGNGRTNGREAGQKATDGGSIPALGPDLTRIAEGKPPRIPATGPRSKQ